MAISLKGTLNTVAGPTSESYLRIEFVKFMPWVGKIEYNPILFKNAGEAAMSRIRYYEDEPPTSTFVVPPISMSLQSGSFSGSVEFEDLQHIPLTGALQEITINHYTQSIVTQSVEVTDFDDDGNEITTTEIVNWPVQVVYSQSIEEKHPIDLSRSGSILEQCYTHFKDILAEQVPAENILDV